MRAAEPRIRMTDLSHPAVNLCIPTFRRPEGLRKLLTEVARLDYPGRLGVFVVENDAEGREGAAVVAAMATNFPFSLTCVHEARRGQTFAYNTGFRAASRAVPTPDYVAVLDDDEYPASNWLIELVAVADRYRADIVGGPVYPVFDDPGSWLAKSGLYQPENYPTGPLEMIYGAGNMLIRRSALDFYLEEPFSHAYAFTGGSDYEFFTRCRRDGRSFAWAKDARVSETVPRSRTTLAWLVKRGFRKGACNTRIDRVYAAGLPNAARRWAKGLGLVVHGVTLMPAAALRGRRAMAERLFEAARGAGRIAAEFNFHYEEYR